jgi:hypothetical protein
MNKKLLSTLLLAAMIISMLSVLPTAYAAAGEIYIDPCPVAVTTTSPPAGWPNFDVEVRVSNVTNIVGIIFSMQWNPSLMELLSVTKGDFLLPAGAGGDFYAGPTLIDNVAGKLHEVSWTQLAAYAPKTFTDSASGLVVTLGFNYTGPDPVIGTPVTDFINFTDYLEGSPPHMQTTYSISTSGTPQDFADLGTCVFSYEAELGPINPPTAAWTIVEAPPYYAGSLTFDASASTSGQDGDGACPITQYNWTWGDGEPNTVTALDSATHTFASPGIYTVCLQVLAPGVGWSDPSYVNLSAPACDDVLIQLALSTGIDVYTESFRQPCYNTTNIGLGANTTVCVDPFMPQENVTLCAEVKYNDCIVQNKLVHFDIAGPLNAFNNITICRTAVTNVDGIACISFRIPWPCENAEEIVFGNWTVQVSVYLPDPVGGEEICYMDELWFEVKWIVTIDEVRTTRMTGSLRYSRDREGFKKCDYMGIEVDITNWAKGERCIIVCASIYDDAGTPIGMVTTTVTLDGLETDEVRIGYIHIPKWAYAGTGPKVYVNVYMCCDCPLPIPWSPEQSKGFAIGCPEFSEDALAYPWWETEYCIIANLTKPISEGGGPICTPGFEDRVFASYVDYAIEFAVLTDNEVNVDDIQDALVIYLMGKSYVIDEAHARDILASAEANCGWPGPYANA